MTHRPERAGLTELTTGAPSKPSALLLSDGRILVGFSEIHTRGPRGLPIIQRLGLMLLEQAAPS